MLNLKRKRKIIGNLEHFSDLQVVTKIAPFFSFYGLKTKIFKFLLFIFTNTRLLHLFALKNKRVGMAGEKSVAFLYATVLIHFLKQCYFFPLRKNDVIV